MHPSSTPWIHEKTLRFSDVFRGVEKGCIETNGLTWKVAITQALLSTAVFPQRFNFFTVCLIQWLRGGDPMVETEGEIFEI